MELTRREFIATAIAASAASIPALQVTTSPEHIADITLGWGFQDDPSMSNEDMARLVVDTMERNLEWYEFRGWRKEPEWTSYQRNGKDVYKLSCRPLVVVNSSGQPIRNFTAIRSKSLIGNGAFPA